MSCGMIRFVCYDPCFAKGNQSSVEGAISFPRKSAESGSIFFGQALRKKLVIFHRICLRVA